MPFFLNKLCLFKGVKNIFFFTMLKIAKNRFEVKIERINFLITQKIIGVTIPD